MSWLRLMDLRGVDSTEAGGSEVSAQRGRRDERARETAAAHAQAVEPRHQANFGWDWTGELVMSPSPAQHHGASALKRRAMEGGARRRRGAK